MNKKFHSTVECQFIVHNLFFLSPLIGIGNWLGDAFTRMRDPKPPRLIFVLTFYGAVPGFGFFWIRVDCADSTSP